MLEQGTIWKGMVMQEMSGQEMVEERMILRSGIGIGIEDRQAVQAQGGASSPFLMRVWVPVNTFLRLRWW